MSAYMRLLLLAGFIPFVLSFYPPLRIYRHFHALERSILLILFIFGGWDVFATWRGHWNFDPESVWPFRIFNLPVEEVLFFMIIPFCCIFTWEVINFLRKAKR